MNYFSIKKIINIGLLTVFFLFIIFYTHSRTAFLSQGANLSVSNLSNGQVVTESGLEILGVAQRATKLTINNRELAIDENGNFTDTLIFTPGLNNIEIVAEDKYGKGDDLKYEILYKEQESESLASILERYNSQTHRPVLSSTVTEETPLTDTPSDQHIEQEINNDILLEN